MEQGLHRFCGATVAHQYCMECFVEIDTHNDFEIYHIIVSTIPFMDGWTICKNAQMGNDWWGKPVARFFGFDLEKREFQWLRDDAQGTGEEIRIQDAAHISQLLEQINEMGREFANIPKPTITPQTFILDSTDSISSWGTKVEKDHFGLTFEKIKNSFVKKYKESYSKNGPTMFVSEMQCEPWTEQESDISHHHYDEYIKSIEYAKSIHELTNIRTKLNGLHGPRANMLKSFIVKRIKQIQMMEGKAQWDTYGGTPLKYEPTYKFTFVKKPKPYSEEEAKLYSKPIHIPKEAVDKLKENLKDAPELKDAITMASNAVEAAIKLKMQADAEKVLLGALTTATQKPKCTEHNQTYDYVPAKQDVKWGYQNPYQYIYQKGMTEKFYHDETEYD